MPNMASTPTAALKKLAEIPVSVHCWQIDDLTGLENFEGKLTGGIAATGNAGGKPKSIPEYFEQLEEALKLIPGKKKVATHAIYHNAGMTVDRDQIEPKHFTHWVEFAKKMNVGLDFNPTYFSHPKSEDGFTLSSNNEEIRKFWVEHGKRCRKIGEYFGRELGQTCYTNHWIPDGYKDTTVDKLGPRKLLEKSLDEIFEEKIDPKYNVDSVESKLFGLGSEAYVTGSHEFYTNYVAHKGNCIICMDAGHFHPTEVISSKLSFLPRLRPGDHAPRLPPRALGQRPCHHPRRRDQGHHGRDSSAATPLTRCTSAWTSSTAASIASPPPPSAAAAPRRPSSWRSSSPPRSSWKPSTRATSPSAWHSWRRSRVCPLAWFGAKYCDMCGCEQDDWIKRY